jgi:hypothetical protein
VPVCKHVVPAAEGKLGVVAENAVAVGPFVSGWSRQPSRPCSNPPFTMSSVHCWSPETTTVSLAEQPFPPVTFTVYVPAVFVVMLSDVKSPGVHRNV